MPYIAVVGPGDATGTELQVAERVGQLLAEAGVVVVCGGLKGVMEAACRGAVRNGGMTVGILPDDTRDASNPFVTISIPTGMGQMRNGLVVAAADGVIVIGGNWGTLSEVALAKRAGKPVAMVRGWRIRGPKSADLPRFRTADQAVRAVLTATGTHGDERPAHVASTGQLPGQGSHEDEWTSYELAQRHYETDLQLFSTRMNLFLVIQSALFAVALGGASNGKPNNYQTLLAVLGLALSTAWLAVAVSSYHWIKTWRAQLVAIGHELSTKTGIPTSSAGFIESHRKSLNHNHRFLPRFNERLSWYLRPTLITGLLPVMFLVSWIFLGWVM